MDLRKSLRIFPLSFFTLTFVEPALSQFKVNSIQGSGGLSKTQIRDRIKDIQTSLNNPSSVLTSSQLQNTGVSVSAFGGYSLDDHELRYIGHMLANVDIGTTTASLQAQLNAVMADNSSACPGGDCGQGAADWVHEQVLASASGYSWTQVTSSLIDDLIGIPGYTDAILGAGGQTIAALQGDALFTTIANDNSTRVMSDARIQEIKDRVNAQGGFSTQTVATAFLDVVERRPVWRMFK